MSDWNELKKKYNINEAKFWCIMGQIYKMANSLDKPTLIRQTNRYNKNEQVIHEIAKVCYGIKVISDQEVANLIESYELGLRN